MTKKKKILIFIIVIAIVVNLLPYIVNNYNYRSYLKAVPMNPEWGAHVKSEKDYLYLVKKPPYLSFTGYLSISKKSSAMKSGHGQVALIIWPLITGGYEYGFRVQKKDVAYEIYVDKYMNPTKENQNLDVAKQVITENKEELEVLFDNAKRVFEL